MKLYLQKIFQSAKIRLHKKEMAVESFEGKKSVVSKHKIFQSAKIRVHKNRWQWNSLKVKKV